MRTISSLKVTFCLLLSLLVMTACSSESSLFEGSGDVGNPKLKGSVAYDKSTGVYTLTGAGANIWGETDEFFYVWKKVTGDFRMSTRLSFEGIDPEHRKIGIMIRETLDGDSKYADISIHGDGLNSLQWRPAKGAETFEIASSIVMPDHITFERHGNTFVMKTAIGEWPSAIDVAENAEEFPLGTQITLDLPETCYVGIFVCSHVEDKIETAYYSDIKFELLNTGKN